MRCVVTFGTFDLFHYGHLRLLERASECGDKLYVGISSDAFSAKKKGRLPVYNEFERMSIVSALSCVDGVFLEESMEAKRKYLSEYNADVLVMGCDWQDKFDELKDICDVIYLDRTVSISSTEIISRINTDYKF